MRVAIEVATIFVAVMLASEDAAAVNFKTEMLDMDGAVIMDCARLEPDRNPPVCAKQVALTLGRVCASALNTPEANLAASDAARRGMLALKLYDDPEDLVLSAADTKLIVDLIGKRGFGPVIIYRAVKLLDPASIKE